MEEAAGLCLEIPLDSLSDAALQKARHRQKDSACAWRLPVLECRWGGAELTRFDIAVCFLAVECCLGKNDFGLAIYQKMQECRLGDGCGEKAAAQFCALVDSYERNGYDSESLICLDKNLALVDGLPHCAGTLLWNALDFRACDQC